MTISQTVDRIVPLIMKYYNFEELTADEFDTLEDWRSRSQYHRLLPDLFRDPQWVMEELRKFANCQAGKTGIEPVTETLTVSCSTAELLSLSTCI